jgi:Coproporphyrinogen III oxidase and related Fe-S oxidoreductases
MEALQYYPQHLSVYSLIVEEGTPLEKQIANGRLPKPDDDQAADMYELTQQLLAEAGYTQYEISNWALNEGSESRHNKAYWKTTPYLGIGAGAHSFARARRSENVPGIAEYCARIANWSEDLAFPLSAANSQRTELDLRTQMQEYMFLGCG